jgi:hypothetical protein
MQEHDQKPIQGWKAASIMLGVTGFVLLATWVMTSNDRPQSVATSSETGQTVGVAPPRQPSPAK